MNYGNDAKGSDRRAPPCVICGLHPQTPEYRPFCSKRCADIDLNRWLGGVYRIASNADAEEDDAAPPLPQTPEDEKKSQD